MRIVVAAMDEMVTRWLFPEFRLDWFGAGPSSPNKTGALLAILFVAAWWPALRFRSGFWLGLPVAFVAAVFLLQTESRGAVVGAVAGSVVLLSVGRFSVGGERGADEWQPRVLRRLTGACALLLLVIYSQQLGVNERMAAVASGEDGSSNVRVALYSAGMAMLAAAPGGWGTGEAGNVYGQWYQEIGDGRSYLSLVNSHLTWMSERGLLFRFLYIAAWCFALLLCLPLPWTPLRAVALGCWLTLGICGFFSSVLTLPWLWVVPGLLLLFCLVQRFGLKDWPGARAWLACGGVAVLGFGGLHGAAYVFATAHPIQAGPERVEIGERPGAVALLAPDRQVLGDKYGHTIREHLDEVGGYTVLRESPAPVKLEGFEKVVLSGSLPQTGLDGFAGEILWLNPPAGVEEAALRALDGTSVTVVVGGMGDWRRSRRWAALSDERAEWDLVGLRGVADFVPDWPRYLEPLAGVLERSGESAVGGASYGE